MYCSNMEQYKYSIKSAKMELSKVPKRTLNIINCAIMETKKGDD